MSKTLDISYKQQENSRPNGESIEDGYYNENNDLFGKQSHKNNEEEPSIESSLSAESESNSVSSNPGDNMVNKWKKQFRNQLSFPFKYSQEDYSSMEQDFVNEQIQKMRTKKQENFAAILDRALKPKSKQVLRIQPHGLYNLTPTFLKIGETNKTLYTYSIKLFDQVINFGKIYDVMDSDEKEWFGKKGGKKPRKGPAKKKAAPAKGKQAEEEGIWTEDIWTYTQDEWDTITSEELSKIREEQILKVPISIISNMQKWQIKALSIDVCRVILESGIIEEIDEVKALLVTEKLRIHELSKEEKSWIEYEELTKYPALLWTEQDQTQQLSDQAKAEQQKKFKEMQEAYKQRKKDNKNAPDEDIVEPALKLQPTFEFTLNEKTIPLLEKAINEGGTYATFTRFVNVDEEELSKLKKKFKGDQVKELNKLVCQVWLDLRPAQSQGCNSFLGRGYLKQVFLPPVVQTQENEDEDDKKKKKKAVDEDDLDPNCNPYPGIERTYLKIEFKTIDGSMLTPVTGEIMPNVTQIIPDIQGNLPLISNIKKYVAEFKSSLKKSINAIIDDYGTAYQTDLTRAEELKKHGVFNDQQKRLFINKRKEAYVNNLYCSSKFDKLKNEISGPLMSLVHDKFEKNLSPVLFDSKTLISETGVKLSPQTSESEKLLSEIFIYIQKELEKYTDMVINSRISHTQLNKTSKTQGNLQESEHDDSKSFVHEDLIQNYTDQKLDKNKFFEDYLNQETDIKKQLNLCLEYESLDLKDLADNRYKDLLVDLMTPSENSKFEMTKHSQFKLSQSRANLSSDRSMAPNTDCHDEDEIWYQYSLFKIRELDYIIAEEALWKALSCTGAQMPKFVSTRDYFAHPKPKNSSEESTQNLEDPFKKKDIPEHVLKYKTLIVCFYLFRGKVDLAKNLVLHLLSYNRLSTLLNTFLSFIYFHYLKDPKLGKKYFNVSYRVTLKNLGYIKSNQKNRSNMPKSKKVHNKVLDKLPELSEEEKDEIWMELIVFLSNNFMIELTKKAVTFLSNQNTFRVNLIHSSLAFLEKNYKLSDELLDKILESNQSAQQQIVQDASSTKKKTANNKQIASILLRKSFNSFMNQRFYEAEEYIFSAIKNDPKLADFSVLLRLGYIYLKRESIEDAYTILSKACNVNRKSALVWLGLAVSALNLNRLEEAEASLRMANILDPINSEIWGYSILLGFKDERKVDLSLSMLEKYLSLQIQNLEVLNQIGEVLINLDYDIQAYSVFFRLINLNSSALKTIKGLNLDIGSIHPSKVKAGGQIKIQEKEKEKDGNSPVVPRFSNNLNKQANKKEQVQHGTKKQAVNSTKKKKVVNIKPEEKEKLLLAAPIFIQENSPHTPNINLPKIYWIVGQLLHKFQRFAEAIEQIGRAHD